VWFGGVGVTGDGLFFVFYEEEVEAVYDHSAQFHVLCRRELDDLSLSVVIPVEGALEGVYVDLFEEGAEVHSRSFLLLSF
jgi:hypothetical protein